MQWKARFSGGANANQVSGFALKADIKHYFQTVDHKVLLDLIAKRVKDKNVLWLVNVILDHYTSGIPGKGMPLGNWTSQFFANIYLNELDQFVKHKVKAKSYLRYVDDFVILHESKKVLQQYEQNIKEFLQNLKLELHPDKCQIVSLGRGVSLLGFRVFYHYKLVRSRNWRKIKGKIKQALLAYEHKNKSAWDILEMLRGWNAYSMHGNTFKLRENLQNSVEQRLQEIKN